MPLDLHHAHAWDLSPKEAVAVQRRLAPRVRHTPLDLDAVETVCGVDVGIKAGTAYAALAVVRLPEKEVVEAVRHQTPVAFPYVPGLLSFREMPAALPALDELQRRLGGLPDVFMTDSHGLAHPRRFGLACHLGVLLDKPALGVAKTRLVGRHDEPDEEKGAHVPLEHNGETVGAVVRTRTRVKPVFVSVGHRCTLEDAVALALRCTTRYKLPEPTRQAHLLTQQRGGP